MIAAMVSIYGMVADPVAIGERLGQLAGILPGGAVDIIGEQVKRITEQPASSLGLSFFIGLAVSLWSANAGVKAIFDALNVAYGETEKRSFLMLNAQSLAFTLGAVVAIIVALAAVVVVPIILRYVWLNPTIEWLIGAARWVALLLGVMFGLALLYRFGPSREQPRWAWLSPGAIVAALVWLGASMLFSFYAANFGSYNETYGSLGAAIGFMTWIWISATIIIIGAELNSEVENQTNHPSAPGDKEGGPRKA
jgi:membrane protein